MAVTYEKLRIEMAKRNIEWKDLVKAKVISQPTRRKLVHEEYVDLKVLDSIANYLGIDIGDIVAIKKDSNS